MVLHLWVAIVMVIVALSIQTIDCMSKVVVCICVEVQETFVLDFHVGGLIVSCGCFLWFGGSNLGVGWEGLKARWVGSRILEAMLKITSEGPCENF